jgi:hypothetical protein
LEKSTSYEKLTNQVKKLESFFLSPRELFLLFKKSKTITYEGKGILEGERNVGRILENTPIRPR